MASSHLCFWSFIALLLFTDVSFAADGADDDPDLDIDIDGLDEDGFDADPAESAGSQGPMTQQYQDIDPAEDFDLSIPEEERKRRMKECHGYTIQRVTNRREAFEGVVKQVAEQRKLKPEMAANSILFSWMMSCYLNIEPEDTDKAAAMLKSDGFTDEFEKLAFAPRPEKKQQVQAASKAQWSLLEKVATDIQKAQEGVKKQKQEEEKKQRQQQQTPGSPPQNAPPMAQMSGSTQFIYIVMVFGTIFGLGLLAVTKLSGSETVYDNDRQSAKAGKKAAKKEKKRN